MNTWLAGFFACAAILFAIHWWHSRREIVFLVFAIQCGVYTAFCLALSSYFEAKTISQAQTTLDRFVTIGVLVHGLTLHFYAHLGGRRDLVFRALLTCLIVGLAVLHQWAPLRGAVTALQAVELPGGAMSLVSIRTPPGAPLAVLYVAVLVVQGYGFFVARGIWKHDRTGGALVTAGAAVVLAGAALGFLIDFMSVRAPYAGAWPHAIFVVCAALVLSREYSARAARLSAAKRQFELVATRTQQLSEAKEEAERASHAKSQLLAHMSHEIRNPLHAILAYAQSLERDGSLGEAQRTKAAIVRSSGKDLQALTDDLLEMSKIEAGRLELTLDAFQLWETLVEVEWMFSAQAASKGVELTIEHDSALPSSLLGDRAKVKRILINLVSNALKFTKRGSIILSASASELADGSIRTKIEVTDTGIGIAPREIDRVFQPFEQLDAGKRAGGVGLGLAISLSYARLMNGDLRVESTPGVGTTFTLTFVAERGELVAAVPTGRPPSRRELDEPR